MLYRTALGDEEASAALLRRFLYLSPEGPRARQALAALRARARGEREAARGEPEGAAAIYGGGNEQRERGTTPPSGKEGLQAELYRLRLLEARAGGAALGPTPEEEAREAVAQTWKPAPAIARGLEAHLAGDYPAAIEAYALAEEKGTDRAHAAYLRGLALARLDRREESLEALARAAAGAPGSVLYAYALARGLAASGRSEEAKTRMEEILEIDPGFGPARGYLLAAEGPPEDADE